VLVDLTCNREPHLEVLGATLFWSSAINQRYSLTSWRYCLFTTVRPYNIELVSFGLWICAARTQQRRLPHC
jgi:hypothetical protein